MTFYIILGALLSSHLMIHIPLKDALLSSSKSASLSYKIITDKNIDDKKKELLIASHALVILKNSIKFILLLIISLTPILMAIYFEYMSISLTLDYLFNLQNIFLLTIIFIVYLFIRKMSINGFLFKNR